MIGTNFSYEQYEKRRIERHKAQGLRFVPEGDVPKVYCVVCANASDWNEIHNYIINENEIDGIPNRKIECTNLKKTCDRIGSYEISDAEAEQLKNHPKVIGVNIDEGYYEGTYKGRDDFIMSQPVSKINRYGGSVKIGRDLGNNLFINSGSDWLSKTGAQIYRHQTLDNPWKNQSDNNTITDSIEQYGDGTDVDVIVCDTSAWFGHIEFVKTGVGEPSNYVGGNVLKSGFSSSATTGVCGALDLILQGPYYLDPDFFEADPSNRLRVRWDGTTVPVDTVATDWWYNESTTYRSAKYVGTNSGGTAVIGSKEDFGSIYVASQYTETLHNGSNTALHTGEYDDAVATHGTPCMSQAYGKTHGWAYNANKWFISIIWANGAISTSSLWEVIKVFHDNKPNRSSDNTKNPTITSHSWGSSTEFFDGEYSYFRTSGDGTGEESITITQSTGNINLEWLDNFYGNRAEYYDSNGNLQPARGKHGRWYPTSNSIQSEGASMIDSGVIFMASAGNNNQQQVKGDHPNYNNYVSTQNNRTLASAESLGYEMVNRPGNPSCIGNVNNYNGGGIDVYRSFNVGALNDNQASNGDGSYKEGKASYSNMGNAVDFYTIGDESIGAKGGPGTGYNRNDSSYRLDSNYNIVTSGGTLSLTSQDRSFNGTSSACPVGAGLFATKLQHNRSWLWSDLKNWLENEVTDLSSDTEFTQGTEATTSNDSNWSSQTNLQGGPRKILWDAPTVDPIVNILMKGRLSMYLSGSGNSTLSFGTTPLFAPIVKRTAQVSTNGLTFRVDASNSSSYSGSGTAWNDLSGNNHNATLVNGPTYTTDDQGAIVFDGVNDYVNVSDTSVLPSGTNSFTYTIWVYIDTVSGNFGGTKKAAMLLSGNTVGTVEIGLFTINNTAGPPAEFRMTRYGGGNTGTCATTVSMNTSAWYNITLVKDGASSQVIYQDGVQIGTGNHSNSFQGGYASVIAGAPSQGTYSGYLDGRIAEVAMYNRALSSAEVMEFYLATKNNHIGGAGGGEGP